MTPLKKSSSAGQVSLSASEQLTQKLKSDPGGQLSVTSAWSNLITSTCFVQVWVGFSSFRSWENDIRGFELGLESLEFVLIAISPVLEIEGGKNKVCFWRWVWVKT